MLNILGCFIHKQPCRKPPTLVHSTSEVGGRLQSNLPFYFSPPGSDRLCFTSSCTYFPYTVLPQMELKRLISNRDWQSPTSTIVTGKKQIAKKTIRLVLTVYWRIHCQKSYSHCLLYVPDWNNLSRRGKVCEKYISSKITRGLCLWRRWVQCWLLLWDEDSIADLVLAAQGHTHFHLQNCCSQIHKVQSLWPWEASGSLKWHSITSLDTTDCPCMACISQCPAVPGCGGFNQPCTKYTRGR